MRESKAYYDRVKVYENVNRILRYNRQYDRQGRDVSDIGKMTMLAQVYFIFLQHPKNLMGYNNASDLYDSTTYVFLSTFKKINDGSKYDRKLLTRIRKTLASVERCVRMIKMDHPYLFNYDLIKKSKDEDKKITKSYGNDIALNDH